MKDDEFRDYILNKHLSTTLLEKKKKKKKKSKKAPKALPSKEEAKRIGESGSQKEKEGLLSQVIKLRMTGELLDGDFVDYLKLLGVSFVGGMMGRLRSLLGGAVRTPAGIATVQLLVASAIGVGVGYGINKLLYDDYEGEAAQRIRQAIKDIEYAKAELDLYCMGRGKLCSQEGGPTKCKVKSIKSRNPFVGGYRYETAGGIGVGDGREKTGEAQREFEALGKSLAKKYGTAGAAAGAAIAAIGTPLFLGSKIAANIFDKDDKVVVYTQQEAFDRDWETY